MKQITISARQLGELSLGSFCERCYWLSLRLDKKLPYQMPMPGIFSSIDSYSKKITNYHYDTNARVPDWFSSLGIFERPMPVPHFSKFFIVDSVTEICLRGGLDEVFKCKDGSFFIVDYKTAKYSKTQDALLPLYEVQLNSYAYIGNRNQFNPVSGLALVYYEPVGDILPADVNSVVTLDGFNLRFSSSLHPVRMDPDKMIPPLLREVRRIADASKTPNRKDGCENCERLDKLIAIL